MCIRKPFAFLAIIIAFTAIAVSCEKDLPDDDQEEEYNFIHNIGTINTLPSNVSTYDECCDYVAQLDGFLADNALYSVGYSMLLSTLREFNVPIAGIDQIEVKAENFKHAKTLMDNIITLDTHCDFAEQRYYNPSEGYSINEKQSRCQVSIERMRHGHQNAQYVATWMSTSSINQTSRSALASAPAKLWDFIDQLDKHLAGFSDLCGIARSKEEILALKKQGKIAFLYGLENGFWTGTDLSNLDKLAEMGFTYITLSHNGDNQICHSCLYSENSQLGLTEFGKQYIARMNDLGILIDLSHTSIGTWRDVLSLSKAPVVFTHSGAAALYSHPRNVTDEILKLLAKNGGVIQLYIVPDFMGQGEAQRIGLKELVQHIEHCIEVAGIDHVGVGIDLDGGGGGLNYNGSNDAINLTVALIEKGYSDSDIEKIWGGNYLRALSEAQRLRKSQ
jgi:Zn-dependent dipeptidase, microsomal dipeptidase homolog